MRSESVISAIIVGAGPYGLSIAAHLRCAGVDFRIFGSPMSRWRCQMPQGMFLKSEGFASNLSDPAGRYTLKRYCSGTATPYSDSGKPVALDVFTQYALAFQKSLAPGVEEVLVERIERENDRFVLRLANGATARARNVIVATGLEHAAHVPLQLADIPSDLCSHSSAHHDLSRFNGKNVTVIGGGQSALETAALLAEQGASVRLLVREKALAWNPVPKTGQRSLYQRLRHPASGLGQGLQVWAYCNAPSLFRHLPRAIRFERVKNVLGPAGAWWLRERVANRVSILLDHVIFEAETRGCRAVLRVRRPEDGQVLPIATDHVIAATGYRFVLEGLPFLSSRLKSLIRTETQAPALSSHFESSVPGLYFTGLASAMRFGPAMRFLEGTNYTARRISGRLAAQLQTQPQPDFNWSCPKEGADSP